jgi:hypothetical protein
MSKAPQRTDYQKEQLKISVRSYYDPLFNRRYYKLCTKKPHVKLAYDTMAHIRSSLIIHAEFISNFFFLTYFKAKNTGN